MAVDQDEQFAEDEKVQAFLTEAERLIAGENGGENPQHAILDLKRATYEELKVKY